MRLRSENPSTSGAAGRYPRKAVPEGRQPGEGELAGLTYPAAFVGREAADVVGTKSNHSALPTALGYKHRTARQNSLMRPFPLL